jgi:hypothetical protein
MEEKIRLRIEDLVFDTFVTSEQEGSSAGTVFADTVYDCTDEPICLGHTFVHACGVTSSNCGTATAPSVCYPPSQVCVTNRQVSCDGTCPGWCDPTSVCGTTGGGGTGSLYCGPEPTQGPDHTCASCV